MKKKKKMIPIQNYRHNTFTWRTNISPWKKKSNMKIKLVLQ